MLWKKENSVFIDLLDKVKYPLHNRNIHRKKNNDLSIRLREEGNEKYLKKDYEGAWNKYNESVCFAENNSEVLSLAYSNRSQCFLKIKMYDRCLVDIELSKKANCSEQLLRKLEKRKCECLNLIKSSVQQIVSEPSADKLPYIADSLQIQEDEVFGRLVRAKRDIEIGEVLLIEKDFVRIVDSDLNNYCTNCGKTKMNFIPCKNCADATFCSIECTRNNFHETECDMVLGTSDVCDGQSLIFILRSLIIGIKNFPTIDKMMDCIDNWLLTNPREISESFESPESKYRAFFTLATVVSNQRILDYRKITYFIFHSITASSIAYKFETDVAKRFLTHLIIHHCLILTTNSFSFEENETRVEELLLLTSYFNHSCLPNVTKLSKGNLSVCKTILPVKENEQLFLTYIDNVFHQTSEMRNNNLEKTYGFRCCCELCTLGTLHANELDNDPAFIYVSSHAEDDNFVQNNLQNIKERCVEFIQRHRDKTRSEEVVYIANTLAAAFSKELNLC